MRKQHIISISVSTPNAIFAKGEEAIQSYAALQVEDRLKNMQQDYPDWYLINVSATGVSRNGRYYMTVWEYDDEDEQVDIKPDVDGAIELNLGDTVKVAGEEFKLESYTREMNKPSRLVFKSAVELMRNRPFQPYSALLDEYFGRR